MIVILRHGEGRSGALFVNNQRLPALIGAGGIRTDKSEGDQATPVGFLPFRQVFYRADRVSRPQTRLRVEALSPVDGWCDDPTHRDYNKHVSLPHEARHERLWRDDHCYDICVVLGWNDDPIMRNRGSAIFLHLPPDSGVTEGCVALTELLLRQLIASDATGIEVRND